MRVPMLADDFADGYDDYYPDDDCVPCPHCHGSGREWEGWPCEYCEGIGHLDI